MVGKTNTKRVVIVEGLISGGKTTLTRELGRELGQDTLVLLEPDEKGAQPGNPYLSDYYGESSRWSFTMQCHLLAMRYRMHLRAQWHVLEGGGHAVMDRSYFGDTAFARLQVKMGLMSEREFGTYRMLYQGMTASVLLPSVCVRVLVSPKVARGRIMRRMARVGETGRRCEAGVSLEYLRGLDLEIDHMTSVLRGMGVTVLDVPWDVDRDTEEQRRSAVQGLAARIEGLTSPDQFLDLHRRGL